MEYKWKKEEVEKLILCVQENSCLYSVRSQDYLDRTKKAMAFNTIHAELQLVKGSLTLEDVRKKWRSLRSQYIRELRLIKNSIKSGSGRDELYQPKLWCFQQLSFLETHCVTRTSEDNIETIDTSTSMSTDNNFFSANDKPIAKRPKKRNKFGEVRSELSQFREMLAKRRNTQKYSWLGSLVGMRMEQIPPEHQEKAAWEIQCVIQTYIGSSCNTRTTSISSSSSNKDLLQLSMDGVFEESDFGI